MKYFRYEALSGVTVTSNVAPIEPKWWDRKALHWIWSYASWTTMVLASHGWKAPQKAFKKNWTR